MTPDQGTASPPIVEASAELLERNLAAFSGRDEDVRDAIASAVSSDIEWLWTPDGVPAASIQGRPLCSRHRPLEEAARLVDPIDVVEHSTFVVIGFGLGHHVARLAERLQNCGIIVILETDMGLLRAVMERIDCTSWLSGAPIVWLRDPQDRATLARKLDGAESTVVQGLEFVTPPASKRRLGEHIGDFTKMVADYVASSRVVLMTTLIRSADTTRNLLLNMDHYAAGDGIEPLQNSARGCLAVTVSAGPSLAKNMELLKRPGVRERCVIIAVQTTLKPLLAAGIRPHFVTALDYHEISSRFYEGLTAADVEGITLVAEPKAHPLILDTWPGMLRCCASHFLDSVLGPEKRAMGKISAGATVSHLALYLADYLGCSAVALIGQDLGFTDGLYYAPGTAIHDVWSPELNRFNTIASMEWTRIVRHRHHLQSITDQAGRTIYTDSQMLAYLKQFERDCSAYQKHDFTVFNATEGGANISGTENRSLASVLESHATVAVPEFPATCGSPSQERLDRVAERLSELADDVRFIGEVSGETSKLIHRMLRDQSDSAKMARHFRRMDEYRAQVDEKMETLNLVNLVNQLGVFKRLKADRRLQMTRDADPMARQRAQLERDQANVDWLVDAADELREQLIASRKVTLGEKVEPRRIEKSDAARVGLESEQQHEQQQQTINAAAMIAIDPAVHAPGQAHSLNRMLRRTLARLAESDEIDTVYLLTTDEAAEQVERWTADASLTAEVIPCGEHVFGDDHRWKAVARTWSQRGWRGGLDSMTIFDEVVAPIPMLSVMRARSIDAALVVGPDWPCVQVTGEHGCDAILRRYRSHPDQTMMTFTQSPPGLCGCVIDQELMETLADRMGFWTVGSSLGYEPTHPQHDPIARDLNVQIQPEVRRSLGRFTADSEERVRFLDDCIDNDRTEAVEIAAAYDRAVSARQLERLPDELVLELTPRRSSTGVYAKRLLGDAIIDRTAMTFEHANDILSQLSTLEFPTVSFDGYGDALLHPEFDRIIAAARDHGARTIHVRTELRCSPEIVQRCIHADIDVLSIDLHADCQHTYQVMMGDDTFGEMLQRLQAVLDGRRATLQGHKGKAWLPWVVPHLQRCNETFKDINNFFDRWMHLVNAAVIENLPGEDFGHPFVDPDEQSTLPPLTPAMTPDRVRLSQLSRRLFVRSDGSIPVDERARTGGVEVGTTSSGARLLNLWDTLISARRDADPSSIGLLRS